jgi:hypothetical protein
MEEKSFSMVEDEAKDRLIQNIQKGLQDPNLTKTKGTAFQNDNLHIKVDPDNPKVQIIKRGQTTLTVDMRSNEFLSSELESSPLAQYSIKCAKLVKFKDTKLEAVQFTQSGSKGKLFVSFARDPSKSRPTLRFHKIKNVKQL